MLCNSKSTLQYSLIFSEIDWPGCDAGTLHNRCVPPIFLDAHIWLIKEEIYVNNVCIYFRFYNTNLWMWSGNLIQHSTIYTL